MSDPWDEALAAGRRAYRTAYMDSIEGAMLTELAMEAALAAFRDAIADQIQASAEYDEMQVVAMRESAFVVDAVRAAASARALRYELDLIRSLGETGGQE